ncbi:hypothetical protein GSI_04764 [Ganoderma sinense ZZ0214-1]|uniref:BTB domain-containing protein n=1 Tax=Ganoderma sinense ZZ0214-1 TaxID=1077348 RepID=A0A2G8SHS6_9APHY|nr:hypothetical protein GSI_04764 [Ganoderma sinense ZZ0214-1]
MIDHPPSNRTDQARPPSYTRDSDFFIDVKPLYLRAENTLFCVPRHYFQSSDVFEGMFTLPDVPNAPQEGSSEACPLFLESIKADELKDFLRLLGVANRNAASVCNWMPNSWPPVLKLASMWQFTGIREKALWYLKQSNCMTRLEVSRQHGIEDWFVPAMRDLIKRDNPLNVDEINKLGLDFAVKVIALREMARGDPRAPRQVPRFSSRFVNGGMDKWLSAYRVRFTSLVSDDMIRRTFEEKSESGASV